MAWGGPLLLLIFASPVRADEVVLLNTDAVRADGTTATQLEVHWPGLSPGAPISAKARRIMVREVSIPGPGIVRLEIVPKLVQLPEDVEIAIQVKGPKGGIKKVNINLVPADPGGLQLVLDPPVIQPGKDGITIRVTPTLDSHIAPSDRPLVAHANLGTVQGFAPMQDGTWLARYMPPTRLGGAATDLLMVSDPTSPDQVFGYAAIPLEVTRKKTFETLWGAQNVLTVGGRTYGPMKSDAGGKVAFEVPLHPAHPTGTLESVSDDGRKTTKKVQLHPGSPSEIAFFPPPRAVPAGRLVTLSLVAVLPGGAPWNEAAPTLKDGNVLQPMGNGIYQARYTAPTKPGPWVVEANVGDRTARVTIQVVKDLPQLELRAEPKQLTEGLQDLRIHGRLTDAGGTALDVPIDLTVSGAKMISGPKKSGPGLTDWWLRPGVSVQQVRASANPDLPSTGLPTSHLVAWSSQHALRPGRVGEIRIAAVDAYGLPVAKQALKLVVAHGDAEVPEQVHTNKNGIARVRVRPGSAEGPVVIRANLGSIASHLTIWLSNGTAPAASPTGPESTRELARAFSELHPTLRISRPEAVAQAAGEPEEDQPDLTFSGALKWLRTGVPEEEEAATTPIPAPTNPQSPAVAPAPQAHAKPAPLPSRRAAPGAYFGAIRLDVLRQTWQQEHAAEDGGSFPTEYNFGGVESPAKGVGLQAAMELWPRQGAYGLQIDWQTTTHPLDDDNIENLGGPSSFFVGVRYRHAVEGRPLRLHASLGGHRTDALVLQYLDDGQTQLAIIDLPLWGVRPSVGLGVAFYRWQGRVEAGETFAGTGFWPIDTWAGGSLDIPLHSPLLSGLYLSTQYERHKRSMVLASGDTQAKMSDSQTVLTVGLGTRF